MKRFFMRTILVVAMMSMTTPAVADGSGDLGEYSNLALTLNLVSVGLGTATSVGVGVSTIDGTWPGDFWHYSAWIVGAAACTSAIFSLSAIEYEKDEDFQMVMVLGGLAALTTGITNIYLAWTVGDLPKATAGAQTRLSPFVAPISESEWAYGLGFSVIGW